jgi:hypothetical protein
MSYSDDSSADDSSDDDNEIKLEKQVKPVEVIQSKPPIKPKKPYEMVEVKAKRVYVRKKPVEGVAMAAKMENARANKKPQPPKEEKKKKQQKEPVQIVKNYYYTTQEAPKPVAPPPPRIKPQPAPPKPKPLIFI